MVFHKKTVRDIPVDNLTVLVRVNYDLPLNKKGEIVDDFWIKSSLPTIEYLLDRGCKVVVISHFGDPIGIDKSYSLEPAAAKLARLLQQDIRFVSNVVGDGVLQAVKRAPNKSVIFLENLRFHSGEKSNSDDFARQLVSSTGARYFVQDGFGIVHSKLASTEAISAFIPSVAGISLAEDYLSKLNAINRIGLKSKIILPGIDVLLD
ncbi:MAG: phosphoglycerate kinase [Candidatus Saccharibacteria bacterium]